MIVFWGVDLSFWEAATAPDVPPSRLATKESLRVQSLC